jgi:hypothetical protein
MEWWGWLIIIAAGGIGFIAGVVWVIKKFIDHIWR